MKYLELKKSLKENLYNVYLIAGDDRYLCHNSVKLITEACNINFKDMNVATLENASVQDIISSSSSYPFIDQYRLVVVKEFSGKNINEKDKTNLINYINNPLKSTVLVFLNFTDDSFFKNLKTSLCFVDANRLDAKTLNSFIISQFNKNGIQYQQLAINLIAEYCLFDMQRISSEVEKLISFSAGKEIITAEVVDNLVVKDKDYQIYSLAEYLNSGRGLEANDLVDTLSKKNGYSLLMPLYNNYRRVLYVAINANFSDSVLSQKLGVKEFAINKARIQAKVFSPKKLKQIVDMISDMDTQIKKGKIKEDVAIKFVISNILNFRNAK